jgi:endonuclease YncB( thermonuclease family)
MIRKYPHLAVVCFFLLLGNAFAGNWQKLENCRLAHDQYMDGDSFHVLHQGKNYIFRLYFVDCPETDTSFPKRVADQMHDFGLASDKAVVAAGLKSKEFTIKMLAGQFTVLTKWEDARGNSRQPRNYAVILVGNKNLAEELARAGLARAFGMPADYPDAARAKSFKDNLRRLQANAIRQKLGAFAGTSRVLAPTETAVPEREFVDFEADMDTQILQDGLNGLRIDLN